jgi:hypothetical protein
MKWVRPHSTRKLNHEGCEEHEVFECVFLPAGTLYRQKPPADDRERGEGRRKPMPDMHLTPAAPTADSLPIAEIPIDELWQSFYRRASRRAISAIGIKRRIG